MRPPNWLLSTLALLLPVLCNAQRTFANTKFDLSPDLPIEENLDPVPANIEKRPETVLPSEAQMQRTLKPALPIMELKIPQMVSSSAAIPEKPSSGSAHSLSNSISVTLAPPLDPAVILLKAPTAKGGQEPSLPSKTNSDLNLKQALGLKSPKTGLPPTSSLPPVASNKPHMVDSLASATPRLLSAPKPKKTLDSSAKQSSASPPPQPPASTAASDASPPSRPVSSTSSSRVAPVQPPSAQRLVAHPRRVTPAQSVVTLRPASKIVNLKHVISAKTIVRPVLASSIEDVPRHRILASQSWYQEVFDVTRCRKDILFTAAEFRKKFPSKVMKSGKDERLAEVIQHRLLECQRKEETEHWDEVDEILAKTTTVTNAETELCLNALLEERISCMNLISYTCQFIQPAYSFRLLPAKIIVKEARYAERAAEKCRDIVQNAKKRLEAH